MRNKVILLSSKVFSETGLRTVRPMSDTRKHERMSGRSDIEIFVDTQKVRPLRGTHVTYVRRGRVRDRTNSKRGRDLLVRIVVCIRN